MSANERPRVMMIEDSEADSELLRVSAASANLDIEWDHVLFAEDALTRLEAGASPDLILLDLSLPGLSGVEFLEERRSRGLAAGTPILVLTSSRDPADVARCYQHGANAFVTKPNGLSGFRAFMSAVDAFWLEFATTRARSA